VEEIEFEIFNFRPSNLASSLELCLIKLYIIQYDVLAVISMLIIQYFMYALDRILNIHLYICITESKFKEDQTIPHT